MDLTNNSDCKSYLYNLYVFMFTYLYSRLCLFNGFLDFLAEAAPVAAAGVGVAAVAGVYASPSLPMTLPSGVPPGSPQPGTPGGGASPTAVAGAGATQVASAQTLTTALALVPAGLAAVAVFPPYLTPRTIPAVSVIFAEDPQIRYEACALMFKELFCFSFLLILSCPLAPEVLCSALCGPF